MTYKSLLRFLRYSFIGSSTFGVDLLLLYLLTDIVGIEYLIATAISFLLAVSLNFSLSRKYVFKGSDRTLRAGYVNFLSIALVGVLFVVGGMYILVGVLGIQYLVARIGVATVTGFWNYLLNLFVNFNVAGKH